MTSQREQFEAWAGQYHDLGKDSFGFYVSRNTFQCWQAWQAAQQRSEPDKSVMPPDADYIKGE